MRVRLLIALAVVGFASPWVMVADQMLQAPALEAPAAIPNQNSIQAQD